VIEMPRGGRVIFGAALGCRVICRAVLCGLVALSTHSLRAQGDDGQDRFHSYLARHGLDALIAEDIEDQLSRSTDAAARRELRQHLAAIYAEMAEQADARELAGIESHLAELARPADPRDVDIELILAQVRYRRAKEAFDAWLASGRDPALRGDAYARASAVANDLDALRRAWSERAATPDDGTTPADSPVEYEGPIAQATYLSAWAAYYAGLVAEDSALADAQWQAARDRFCELIVVSSEEQLARLDPDSLDLETPWIARAVLGLAMTLEAWGRRPAAEDCFELLRGAPVPDIADQLDAWRFQAATLPGHLDRAVALARELDAEEVLARSSAAATPLDPPSTDMILASPPSHRVLPDSFWRSVVEAGATWPQQNDPHAAELIRIGLTALARQQKFAAVDQLVAAHGIELEPSNFYLAWALARRMIDANAEAPQAAVLEQARAVLAAALEENRAAAGDASPDGATPAVDVTPVEASQVAFLVAWIDYHQGRLASAAESFGQIADKLRFVDPATAAEALWARAQALEVLKATDPSLEAARSLTLARLERWFPGDRRADQARFLRQRARESSLPIDQQLESLSAYAPTHPCYALARAEFIRLLHDQWSAARASSDQADQAADWADRLLTAVTEELAAESRYLPAQRMEFALWGAEVTLRRDPAGLDEARVWLDQARGELSALLPTELVVSQYYFLVLEWSRAAGDESQAREAATWLMDHSSFPPYAVAGTMWLAESIDRQLAQAAPADREGLVARAVELYERLAAEYARDGQSIETSANARVTLARLAEYRGQERNYAAALEAIEPLLRAFPDNVDYMTLAARAHMQLDQRAKALPLWRRLSGGLPPGQPEWCEAQFQLAVCVADTDPATARRIIEQTRQLAPEMPDPWPQRFSDLDRRLGQ